MVTLYAYIRFCYLSHRVGPVELVDAARLEGFRIEEVGDGNNEQKYACMKSVIRRFASKGLLELYIGRQAKRGTP